VTVRIASLHVHPIKSCRGVAVTEASLDERGLVDDRRWMVVDEGGEFVTQRREPRLNRVQLAVAEDGWRVRAGDAITIRPADASEGTTVSVWGDPVAARVHREGSVLLSEHLGRSVRLVFFGPEAERHAGSAAPSAKVAFADAYPLLLVGQASLDALNERLEEPVPMTRFRPNVVVTGGEPHAEDGWSRLRLGSIEARMVKRCDRCSIVTVDDEGVRQKEPLATLATYRRDDSKVLFGVNVVHEGTGTLRVGDPVEPYVAPYSP
jgi:uncharacterized protein YcbX